MVERKGARIVSAAGEGTEDDDPTSVLMRVIIDGFAQYERAIIGLRTKLALQAKRARGERAGTLPDGWQLGDGAKLIPHEHEQQALTFLRGCRQRGYTLRRTAAVLNEHGFRTRRGGLWHHQYVLRLEGRR